MTCKENNTEWKRYLHTITHSMLHIDQQIIWEQVNYWHKNICY